MYSIGRKLDEETYTGYKVVMVKDGVTKSSLSLTSLGIGKVKPAVCPSYLPGGKRYDKKVKGRFVVYANKEDAIKSLRFIISAKMYLFLNESDRKEILHVKRLGYSVALAAEQDWEYKVITVTISGDLREGLTEGNSGISVVSGTHIVSYEGMPKPSKVKSKDEKVLYRRHPRQLQSAQTSSEAVRFRLRKRPVNLFRRHR